MKTLLATLVNPMFEREAERERARKSQVGNGEDRSAAAAAAAERNECLCRAVAIQGSLKLHVKHFMAAAAIKLYFSAARWC